MNPTTDVFGNTVAGSGWTVPNQTSTPTGTRRPGNFLTHLLPAVGGTLGAIIGSPLDLIGGPSGTIAGGAGGSAIGKILENKFEKQGLGSGVLGQAAIGGASGLGGELLGAGGSFLSNLLTKGTGEATSEIGGEVAGNAAADVGKQNIGERLMQSVRGLSPENLPGNTVSNVPEAARLNQVAEGLGLKGSSTQQLSQLSKLFDQSGKDLGTALEGSNSSTSADLINNAIDNSIKAHPLNPSVDTTGMTDNQIFALKQAGTLDHPAGAQFDQAGNTIKNIVAKMSHENGGNFSDSEINTLRQQVDKLVNFNASPNASPDIMNEAARSSRTALNSILEANNPEARGLISNQSDMIKLGDALGKQSGYARAGVRIGGVRVPVNVGSALESGQAGVATLLGSGSVADRAVPAIAQGIGQEAGNQVSNATQSSESQNNPSTDLTAVHPDITKALNDYANPVGSLSGLPSSDKIKQAEEADLATTGGKNYSFLSKLGTLASTQESETKLPGSAATGLGVYQNNLGTLQKIADAFGDSKVNYDQLNTLMGSSLSDLSKATGMTSKQLTALLPNPSDRQDVAVQKLSQVKALIDANAHDSLTNSLSAGNNNNNINQSSLLASLGIGQ